MKFTNPAGSALPQRLPAIVGQPGHRFGRRLVGAQAKGVETTSVQKVELIPQHVANGTKDRQGRHLDRLYFGRLPLSEYAARKLGVAELVK